MNELKFKNKSGGKIKVRLVVSALLFIVFVASLIFAVFSFSAGAGYSAGIFFPCAFSFLLFFVTATLNFFQTALGRLFLPLMIIFYTCAGITLITFGMFCLFTLNYESQPLPEKIDKAVVLGCQTYGYTPSKSLKTRLDSAFGLLSRYSGIVCIVSGGQGPDETIPEAVAMKTYLVNMGYNPGYIIEEAESHSTYQNLKYTKTILGEYGLKNDNIVIITNEFHIPRAMMLAARLGYENIYACAAPSPPSLLAANIIREYLAYIKSFLIDRD